MSRTFTRQQFYDLVWSKPMTHLAKEFRLSDVALHKICRKHTIPTPPAGWWAKKAAGKVVTVTPLPRDNSADDGRITISGGELRQESEPVAAARETARVLASAFAADEDAPSHPIVEQTVARLRKAKPSEFNGLVSAEGPDVINVRVSPGSVERFEFALNRIIYAAQALGNYILDATGARCWVARDRPAQKLLMI